ncbi:hypothetical protein [Pseudoalteromonas luteoviolacea]|uniref:hypothetical protein n=1 Tax=Pseudoalteromonas luteoviolacea TaxID=43657 RepID=UPI001B35CFEE|nr:hypothetical protein [Pseudoalteromonas luteoviolacea]MBQ4836061.1 hypothetical protein [Pseudoalteromonas luteoviolacea]
MTQQERLEEIISGPEYWSLEEICHASRMIFKKLDTPAAMSARWRNVVEGPNKTKHKRIRPGAKRLWEYRIEIKSAANDD